MTLCSPGKRHQRRKHLGLARGKGRPSADEERKTHSPTKESRVIQWWYLDLKAFEALAEGGGENGGRPR